MLSFGNAARIYIYAKPTDMRCGFNKLSMMVEHYMGLDTFSGHLFVFFNRTKDKCKILFWDRSGYCIWYKQLQKGTFRYCNKEGHLNFEINMPTLTLILEGINLDNAKQQKRFRK